MNKHLRVAGLRVSVVNFSPLRCLRDLLLKIRFSLSAFAPRRMTPAEIAEAKRLATPYIPKN
jgi:hypothetical protein